METPKFADNVTLQTHEAHEEGFLHYFAREGRRALQWTIVLSLFAIVGTMVTPFWFLAIIPVVILLTSYILLTLTNEVERRSDGEAHDALERTETATFDDIEDDAAEAGRLQPVDAHLVKREGTTGIAIVCGIMVVAFLIAAFRLPGPVVAIGSLVVFAYMLLLAAPFWLGFFNDDVEDESQRFADRQERVAAANIQVQ